MKIAAALLYAGIISRDEQFSVHVHNTKAQGLSKNLPTYNLSHIFLSGNLGAACPNAVALNLLLLRQREISRELTIAVDFVSGLAWERIKTNVGFWIISLDFEKSVLLHM